MHKSTFQEICREFRLGKDQSLLLALYTDGMQYDESFIRGMANEIKTMNAIDTKRNIRALQGN